MKQNQKRRNNAALTRQKILDAAVEHFGMHGYQGASLRNTANYHFGSKKNVYFAVLSTYFEKTRETRLALMKHAAELPLGDARVRALIEAYISPHIRLIIEDGEHAYGRLIVQIINDNELITDEIFSVEINKVRLQFRKYLRECYSDVSDDILSRGIGLIVATMAQAPFDPSYRTLTNKSPLNQSSEDLIHIALSFAFGGIKELFRDLSMPIENDVKSDPEPYGPKITYLKHDETFDQISPFFPGLKAEQMPDGEAWAVELLELSTHNGTHMDAPWHFHSTQDSALKGGAKPAMTIDELPLEWCQKPGVKLDFRHFEDGHVVTAQEVDTELDRIGYTLKPTGRKTLWV